MERQTNETTQAILIVNFSYALSQEQLLAGARNFAENVKPMVAGLIWKIFVNQPENRRAGGIYLFRDAESARNYVNSPILEKLKQTPGLSGFSIELFETMTEASVIAGASMGARAA
jgi:Putative mono-oxygenase ydhR